MAERELSRRNLFRRFVPEATEEVTRKVRGDLGPLPLRRRPPGAVDEARFLELCTRCSDCSEACPHYAVHALASWVGIGGGTPVMVPDQRACHLCEGFPCAAACETGALELPATPLWKLGSVRLVQERCLPFMGPECGACAGLCPPDAPALRLVLTRPSIERDVCVGCGRCIEACPTDPKAIELLELEE